MPVYEYACLNCRKLVSVLVRSMSAKTKPKCPECGSSEVRLGKLGKQRFITAIEPWHGNQVVVYLPRGKSWKRVVIEDGMLNAHALAVGRRHRVRLANAQFVEFSQGRRVHHALGLVDRQHHLLAGGAQVLGDVVVLRRKPSTRIHDEHDDIRLGNGLAGLLGHLLEDAALGIGLEAARVDDDEFVAALARIATTGSAPRGRSRRPGRTARRLPAPRGSAALPASARRRRSPASPARATSSAAARA